MRKPLPRRLRILLKLASAPLTILGLAGLPDDIKTWGDWLRAIGSDAGRWILAIIGLALLGWSLWEDRRARRRASTRHVADQAHHKRFPPTPGSGELPAVSAAQGHELEALGDDTPDRVDQPVMDGRPTPIAEDGSGIVVEESGVDEEIVAVPKPGGGFDVLSQSDYAVMFVANQIDYWIERLRDCQRVWATLDMRVGKIGRLLGRVFGEGSTQREHFRHAPRDNASPMCPHRIERHQHAGMNDAQFRAEVFIRALQRIRRDLQQEQIQANFEPWNSEDPELNP